ncbi:MAG: hypothetical protein IAI50_03530 [Candidatus Eremiobacteraeota bacterium]|nr:hypothetical protein [Candidatus Eremiobacteraeota bacterium]
MKRNLSKAGYLVTGSVTLVLIAGCASGGSGVTTPAAGAVTQQSATRAMPGLRESFSVARAGVRRGGGAAIAVKPFINADHREDLRDHRPV